MIFKSKKVELNIYKKDIYGQDVVKVFPDLTMRQALRIKRKERKNTDISKFEIIKK